MIDAAWGALRQIFTPPYRAILWKVLALTLALLVGLWMLLDKLAIGLFMMPWSPDWAAAHPWLQVAIGIITGLGLVAGLVFAIAPLSSLVAGFFLDDLADLAERADPTQTPGTALPAATAVWLAAKFAAVSLLVNILALALFLVPGVNAVVFFVANGYLLGREYFELAAMRYHSPAEAQTLRRAHALEVFLGGLAIAAFVAVPVVNLLTPLFGTAFMVRFHRARCMPAPVPARQAQTT